MVRLALVVLVVACGCDAEVCVRHSDCAPGMICGARARCVVAPVAPGDGGAIDGDHGDGGTMDLSTVDRSTIDLSTIDLSTLDLATVDLATTDLATTDVATDGATDLGAPRDALSPDGAGALE